jgi:hypothetical protein
VGASSAHRPETETPLKVEFELRNAKFTEIDPGGRDGLGTDRPVSILIAAPVGSHPLNCYRSFYGPPAYSLFQLLDGGVDTRGGRLEGKHHLPLTTDPFLLVRTEQ